MPRHAYKRQPVADDPVYESYEVAKLINYIMYDGKKDVARGIVYDVLETIKNEGNDPLRTLHMAIANVAPTVEVKPRRLGGASYLVPMEVRRDRRLYLGLKWIIDSARSKSNKEFKTFASKLLTEIKDAAANQGSAVDKRGQVERMAESNKAFAHLKW